MTSRTRREILGGLAGLWPRGGSGAAQTRRPNLVYVFADQLRYQSCGYAGDEHARTPNIDRLAAEAFNFRNAISSTPVCAPYRASLMTGKYQSSTGMVINELRLSPGHECFGRVLTRSGYHTAYIGKWHLWANQLGHHDETMNGFVPPGPYRLGFDDFWAAYNFNHNYHNAPYFRNRPEREIHKTYEPDSQTEMAVQFIREAAARPRPFALFLSWGPPHDPWSDNNVPPEYAEKFRDTRIPLRPNYSGTPDPYADTWATPPPDYGQLVHRFQRAYYAQAANLDWNLGRIVNALERAGVAGETVLVFTSDHGEMFGSHGRRAKYIFYEEAARVPFLVRWPGSIRGGQASGACLGTPDIMPTLLSLLRLPVPKTVEGHDLSGLLLGTSRSEPVAARMQGMGTTAAWRDGTEWRGLRDHRYTYAIYRRDRRELLFDNVADPYQKKNLAEDRGHTAKLRHYRDGLTLWMKDHNDRFESCTWYRDHWTADRNIVLTASGVKQDLRDLQKVMREHFPDAPRTASPPC
ncbi:MAG: sulfatase [Acidobacteria bacterium]|nr:sulfatase [Acidobacteriota bacterium]